MTIIVETKASSQELAVYRDAATSASQQLRDIWFLAKAEDDKLVVIKNESIESQVCKYEEQIKAQHDKFENIKQLREAARLHIIEVNSSDDDSEDEAVTIAADGALMAEHRKALSKLAARHHKSLKKIEETYVEDLADRIRLAVSNLVEIISEGKNINPTRRTITDTQDNVNDKAEADLELLRTANTQMKNELAFKDKENAGLEDQVKQLMLQTLNLQSQKRASAALAKSTDTTAAAKNIADLEKAKAKITDLERVLKLQEPIFQVGVAVRRGFVNSTKRVMINQSPYVIWGINDEADHELGKAINKAKNDAVHRGNIAVDHAMFLLKKISTTEIAHIYKNKGPFALRSSLNIEVLDLWGTLVACYIGTPVSFNKAYDAQVKTLHDQMLQRWNALNSQPAAAARPELVKHKEFWTLPAVKEWSGHLARIGREAVRNEQEIFSGDARRNLPTIVAPPSTPSPPAKS